jgi:O-antigen ligase
MAIAFFIFWNFITLLWTDYSEHLLRTIRLNFYLLGIFIIATSIKKEKINSIITAFLSGMFVSEMIAYGVFFGLWTFKHATPVTPSPFMMHMDYSVFLAFSSMLLLNRLFSSTYTLKQKFFIGFFFFTVTGNLFLSTGRTGQVALIAAIFVLSFIHYRLTIKSFFISILLLITIFSSAYALSNSFVMRVHQTQKDVTNIFHSNLNGSWGVRVAYWIITYDAVKEHPFGNGLGNYSQAIQEQFKHHDYKFLTDSRKVFMSNLHPHNQYLLIILDTGFIGFLLFLNIIYQLLIYKIKDKEIKEISILFATIFFASCLAEPLLIKQFTLVLFVLFIGLFTIIDPKNTKVSSIS